MCNKLLPRLLYVPNEVNVGDQVGPRSAFEKMYSRGELQDYQTFSFLNELINCGSEKIVLDKLYNIALGFRPDIILWQHIGDFGITREYIKKLKQLESAPTIVYHEGDMYDKFHKRLSKPARDFIAEADLVFVVGLGDFSKLLYSYGANKVLYSPSCADLERFSTEWEPSFHRRYDVVLIGNRHTSKVPFKRLPGAKDREKLVVGLSKMLGEKFAVFGSGWDKIGISSKGEIPYSEQHRVLRDAWISVGWNHYNNIPYYYSDRLPISLLAGVAHVTNYQPGFEKIFNSMNELVHVDSVENALDIIQYLLSLPKGRLIDIGKNGREYALENLTAEIVFKNVVDRSVGYRILKSQSEIRPSIF